MSIPGIQVWSGDPAHDRVDRTMSDTQQTPEDSEQDGERETLLPLERRTYLMSLAAGASAAGGATGGAAASDGTVEQEETAETQDLGDTWVGYGRGEYGSGLYGDVGPPTLSSGEGLPKDLDGDGFFEDIDGDGDFTIFDVQTFFTRFKSQEIRRYAPFYNFDESNNSEVTIFDVQSMFIKLAN